MEVQSTSGANGHSPSRSESLEMEQMRSHSISKLVLKIAMILFCIATLFCFQLFYNILPEEKQQKQLILSMLSHAFPLKTNSTAN